MFRGRCAIMLTKHVHRSGPSRRISSLSFFAEHSKHPQSTHKHYRVQTQSIFVSPDPAVTCGQLRWAGEFGLSTCS